MQTEPNAKQQIVERIKNSTNVLVTVGKDPSVDSLSAALALTFMLNRLDKHTTAVFSGQLPPAINFLEPSKTFENSVDSLRDFIIALDKEKADRLRYKVEDDVVRIFITPYKTVITDKDLKFSQGDFNVELIIALGVEKREDLDTAITAHGRILHDATVVTINADGAQPTLGSIDWTDPSASSLCEMLMSLSEALQSGLLDQQIATSVLTGIVAATDRFRNERTSPRVMTMAAQLMAAGANQQLIAAKLEEGQELPPANPVQKDGSTQLSEGESKNVDPPKKKKKNDGALEIAHKAKADVTPIADPNSDALQAAEAELAENLEKSSVPVSPAFSVADMQKDLAAAEAEITSTSEEVREPTEVTDALEPEPTPEAQSVPDHSPDEDDQIVAPEPITPAEKPNDEPAIIKQPKRSWRAEPGGKPAFGGTLNATTSDAEKAEREETLSHSNTQIMSHDKSEESNDATPSVAEPSSQPDSVPMPAVEPEVQEVPLQEPTPVELSQPPVFTVPEPPVEVPASPFDEPETKPLESTSDDALSFEAAPIVTSSPTLADIDQDTRGHAAEDARAAIDAALSAVPYNPAGKPSESAGASPVFEVNHDDVPPVPAPVMESLPAQDSNPPVANQQGPQPPMMPSMAPPLPPLPDFSTLPPLPGEGLEQVPTAPEVTPLETTQIPASPLVDIEPPATNSVPNDPAQFKIPGQS